MAAVIPQGVSVLNARTVEIASIIFSTNTFPHATKSITVSPREKADLSIKLLTVNASQSRKFPRKATAEMSITCLETDFLFIRQLYYLMQQPIQAQVKTADGEFFSFIKNGTTQAVQVYGSATGSNLGVLGFEFVVKDDARYVTLSWFTELTLAELNYLYSNIAAAVVGVAVTMKSLGTQANATGGQASFGVPGWNTGAPATLTNTGGTAQVGIIRSGELSVKSDGIINYNDNMKFYDRLMVKGTFVFDGVSSNDLLSALGTSLEKCTLILNTYNNDNFKLVGLSLNANTQIGDTDMGTHWDIEGHVVRNPDDSAIAPLPNIDIGQNAATDFVLNLVNN